MSELPFKEAKSFNNYFEVCESAMKQYFKQGVPFFEKSYKEFVRETTKYHRMSLKNMDENSDKAIRIKEKISKLETSTGVEYAYLYESQYSSPQNRKHSFQQWLDGNDNYVEAIKKFERKEIFFPYHKEYKAKELAPISLNSYLDNVIAKMFLFYKDVEKDGYEKYLKVSDKKMDNISKRAEKLLEDIRSDPGIYSKVGHSVESSLKRLSKGMDKHSRKLADPFSGVYSLSKVHDKAGREILIKYLCREYGSLFGRYKIDASFNDKSKNSNIVNIAVMSQFDSGPNNAQSKKGTWRANLDEHGFLFYTIHADVLAEIISMISEYNVDGVSERKIYEIAKRQKEAERERFKIEYMTSDG